MLEFYNVEKKVVIVAIIWAIISQIIPEIFDIYHMQSISLIGTFLVFPIGILINIAIGYFTTKEIVLTQKKQFSNALVSGYTTGMIFGAMYGFTVILLEIFFVLARNNFSNYLNLIFYYLTSGIFVIVFIVFFSSIFAAIGGLIYSFLKK